jgi:hypothetical protein
LKQWADNGWLRPHQTSKKEISGLLRIVKRDIDDAQRDISSDWRFGIAYNAALKLLWATMEREPKLTEVVPCQLR